MHKPYNNVTFFILSFIASYLILTNPVFAEEKPIVNINYLLGLEDDYEIEILRLALDKTKDKYGEYTLTKQRDMSVARGFRNLKDNTIEHGILVDTQRKQHSLNKDIIYADFPIYLGVLGYRICFVNKSVAADFVVAEDEYEVRKFIHGQGTGWADVDILRNNGFTVKEGNRTENLYKMLNAHRVDLFCRGINEITKEVPWFEGYKEIILDRSKAFYYPLNFLFYFNAKDNELRDRIKEGLVIAFNDGSLLKTWKKYFIASVASANMHNRKIIPLKNYHTESYDSNLDKYLLDLQTVRDIQ